MLEDQGQASGCWVHAVKELGFLELVFFLLFLHRIQGLLGERFWCLTLEQDVLGTHTGSQVSLGRSGSWVIQSLDPLCVKS